MSRTLRLVLFLASAAAVAVLFTAAAVDLPPFGAAWHVYRDHAVAAAAAHSTPNVVAAVNFDQRPLDTLVEELILFGSVIGAVTLLRPAGTEHERRESSGRVLDATSLSCYLLLPLTLVIGLDVVVHGHLSPGGGFQGGVVLASGLHLLYLAGWYGALRRLRPLPVYELGEAVGLGGFLVVGLVGVGVASLLANVLPTGTSHDLLSAGTVPVLNVLTGCAVGCGTVVLLAQFLGQEVRMVGESRTSG